MFKNKFFILLMCILMSCVVVSSCGVGGKEDTEQSTEKKAKKKNKKKKDKKKKSDDETDVDEEEEDEEGELETVKAVKKSSSENSEVKKEIADEFNDFLIQDKVVLVCTYGKGADSWSADIIKERHDGIDYYLFSPIDNPEDNTRILTAGNDVYLSTDYGESWQKTEEYDYGYVALSNYLQYANYLSFIYAAIDSGIAVSDDAGAGKYVVTVSAKEGEDLDTDLRSLGILYDTSMADEIDPTFDSNAMALGIFGEDETKNYVFGNEQGRFSIMETIAGGDNSYTIMMRVPNEEVGEVEMMPLNDLINSINAAN